MAEKKQVLRNRISCGKEGFEIEFLVNEKSIKKFVFADLKHLVCFRELIANLPMLKVKLELLLEGNAIKWFENQINKIKTRAENSGQTKKTENKEAETFDLDAYLSKFNLN